MFIIFIISSNIFMYDTLLIETTSGELIHIQRQSKELKHFDHCPSQNLNSKSPLLIFIYCASFLYCKHDSIHSAFLQVLLYWEQEGTAR